MSQQQKLEKVLELLINEDSDQAAELLHQIIVEKARVIYESIVDEEDEVDEAADEDKDEKLDESEDDVGGDQDGDFTAEIGADKAEIDSDEQNGGEAEGDDSEDDEGGEDDEFGGEDDDFENDISEPSTEEKVEDLEMQLAELRAEFDALMGEEFQEPQHAGLAAEIGGIEGEDDAYSDYQEEPPVDEMGMGAMYEKKGTDKAAEKAAKAAAEKKKLAKAKNAEPKGRAVKEETKFLNKVADTGQKGTAKLVGTGKGMTLGAEQTKSPYTTIPPRKDYGGKPTKIGGNGGTGGEYGKYNGDSAKDDTPTDNVNIQPKKNGVKADTTAKWTGGKAAGAGNDKSPLTKKPT